MKFSEFLNEAEGSLKDLYNIVEKQIPNKLFGMKHVDTYFDENSDTYFVSYEGWYDGNDQDEEYAVIYSVKCTDGKYGEVNKYASDDDLDSITKDMKQEYPNLKKK